jgi:hypothetical protein
MRSGTTPLMQAAVYGDLSRLRLLVDRGADVERHESHSGAKSALMRGCLITTRRMCCWNTALCEMRGSGSGVQ